MKKCLADNTGKSIEEINDATNFDNYMNAEEAIEFGTCDEITTSVRLCDLRSKICLLGFAQMNSPISVTRKFQRYIAKQDLIEHDKLFTFALACLLHCDADIIKYGLLMTALYPEPFDSAKDVIRTLGLCNEFTIYTIFNMLHWRDANDEILFS